MTPHERPQALIDWLMRHQKKCGALEQSKDGQEIICTGCGARIVKGKGEAIIETEGHKIGIL